jgi:pyruvate/2-oxoglutarate dehydrogenase complex dihydrolipoamide dehydrogenase (E3) component
MSNTLTPDICVVGAGTAGLRVAAGAAKAGASVVLVEKAAIGAADRYSGDIPAATLLAATGAGAPPTTWPEVRARVNEVLRAIAPMDTEERFQALGVTVLHDAAKFTGPNTIAVGQHVVRARNFVVATGAAPAVPAIAGLEAIRWLTAASIFDLETLPVRLIVIGAGTTGVQFAQAFRRLGSEVTILDAERVLPDEDEELVAPVLESLVREGVAIRTGVTVTRAEPLERGMFRLGLGADGISEWITGTHLLLTAGRRPAVENLGLERADVAFSAKGIDVGPYLRTTNRRIYAAGSVTGVSAQAAPHQADLVLDRLLSRGPSPYVAAVMPRVTLTEPQLAWTGLDETRARAKHRKLRILRAAFSEIDRAVTDNKTTGHLKVIATPSGRVLGAGIVGAHAGELLAPWTMAVANRLSVRDIAASFVPHPTFSELSRKAALDFCADMPDMPILRRLRHSLRRFV